MDRFVYSAIKFDINHRLSYNFGNNRVLDDYIVYYIHSHAIADCDNNLISILNEFKSLITNNLQDYIHWRYNEEGEKVYDKTTLKAIMLDEFGGTSVFIYISPNDLNDKNKTRFMIKISNTGTVYNIEELNLAIHMLEVGLVKYKAIEFKSNGTICFNGMIMDKDDN